MKRLLLFLSFFVVSLFTSPSFAQVPLIDAVDGEVVEADRSNTVAIESHKDATSAGTDAETAKEARGTQVSRTVGAGLGYLAGSTVAAGSLGVATVVGIGSYLFAGCVAEGNCDFSAVSIALLITFGAVVPTLAVGAGAAAGALLGGHRLSNALLVGAITMGATVLAFGSILFLGPFVLVVAPVVGITAAVISSYSLDSSFTDEVE